MAPARRPGPAGATLDLTALTIPDRFNGPPGSAHGGWAAGQLAARVLGAEKAGLGRAARVTLRHPPPLGARQQVSPAAESRTPEAGVVLTFGGALIAEAVPAELDVAAIDPVSPAMAGEAMERYAGLTAHPYPTCFACGTNRPGGDGLGLRPGPLPDRPATTATTWVPGASVAGPVRDTVTAAAVWAALDCPGGWAVDIPGRPLVLGRITAQVDALPLIGERCVVMGGLLGREGRKVYTATTAYDGDGRVFARATATWIETTGR